MSPGFTAAFIATAPYSHMGRHLLKILLKALDVDVSVTKTKDGRGVSDSGNVGFLTQKTKKKTNKTKLISFSHRVDKNGI